MKLNNKFLLIATAVVALPLSVANAEGPAVQPASPEFNGGVNPAEAPVEPALPSLDPATGKPFVGQGQNGPVTINDVKPYAEKGEALINEKPEYKVPSKAKNTVQGKNVQKALPKTSAVK